jgi:hypothetical protein
MYKVLSKQNRKLQVLSQTNEIRELFTPQYF